MLQLYVALVQLYVAAPLRWRGGAALTSVSLEIHVAGVLQDFWLTNG